METSGATDKPTPKAMVWTEELKANLMESLILHEFRTIFFLHKDKENPWYPMRLFSCFLKFCEKAFNGNPPPECTIDEFERMIAQTIPAWV